MASIFTFDPDPPSVSSPWAAATPSPRRSPKHRPIQDPNSAHSADLANESQMAPGGSNSLTVDYSTITRLEAEPQEGPTEYKLHLLLRRRRSFSHTSTGRHVSGSLRCNDSTAPVPVNRSVSDSGILSNTPPPMSSTQSRQHRLEQLTTQLLWRLQQSCSCHAPSSKVEVLVHFPDAAQLATPTTPQRLYPGLEESKGALYEIGVADDGELVGLAEDEMDESLNNLRAMAASLGCQVEVQRMVTVGECEWVEYAGTMQPRTKKSKLMVAEAFVHPDERLIERKDKSSLSNSELDISHKPEQLRVSLTGATMSGKSSLLGTLSTGTLDNGRGKSRLSLLKHRHEIESGVTSSITQELIGYSDLLDPEGARTSAQVINYGSADVSSWVDIHAAAETSTAGRLVFLTDSAGHPRFRRTTIRGLVGWDPHYTLLCIPADNGEDSSGKTSTSLPIKENIGSNATDLDPSREQLQLCLSLELPLVVVITKMDLATKTGLKGVMSRVLSALKDAGRKGCIITDQASSFSKAHMDTISADHLLNAERMTQELNIAPLLVVPIILTSAVNGTGLSKLHAFLRELPVPAVPTPPPSNPRTLFHIEDSYSNKPARIRPPDEPIIIGGHLRYGTLNVGDELMLGPYPVDSCSDDSDSGSGIHSVRNSPAPTSRSFPGAFHKRSASSALHSHSGSTEWRRVRITSLRNLRLPVRILHSGQVGTIGIVPIHALITSPAIHRIQKGMVLADGEPKVHSTIYVRFTGPSAQAAKSWSIGSAVVVFFASVRAPSKAISVTPLLSISTNRSGFVTAVSGDAEEEGFGFGFGYDEEPGVDPSEEEVAGAAKVVVAFQFIASREFVEDGVKVLVVPGGGPGLAGSTERGEKGLAGLEGFVGRVIEGPA